MAAFFYIRSARRPKTAIETNEYFSEWTCMLRYLLEMYCTGLAGLQHCLSSYFRYGWVAN